MRFGLIANPKLDGLEDLLRPIIDHLEDRDQVRLVYEEDLAKHLGREGVKLGGMDVDMVITVGGDGTILRAFQAAEHPVFAVHAGHTGFLTTVGHDGALEGLDRVLSGDYQVEEKLRLKVVLNGERQPDCTNEATIHTSQIAKIRSFSVELDGQTVARFRSDGMIISTPTGSTSYAMSVGGPILAPGVEAFILAPIAPYKLSSRPYVLPPEGEITVRLTDTGRPSLLVLDGQVEMEVTSGDIITLTKSEKRSRLVNFGKDFFERVKVRLDQ